MLKAVRIALALSAASALSACESDIIDDQTKLEEGDFSLINPNPLEATSLEAVAAAHKRQTTLLAVIDSGVDYTHPILIPHIRFKLDENGRPVGTGHDYVGADAWPAPYIARTGVSDPDDDASDRARALSRFQALSALLDFKPTLSRFLHPRRNIEQERQSRAFHGTHVAGLMVYDRPDFGLLSYRVLGHNRKQGDFLGFSHDYVKTFQANVLASIDQAVQDGARVVNLSLGGDAEKPTEPIDKEHAEHWAKAQAFMNELGATLRKHPNTLFVVAAGNSGQWSEGRSRLTLPCNAESSNVLCVGSLDSKMDPSGFTNLPLHSFDVVFALGEDVLSTTPTKMCMSDALAKAVLFNNDRIPDKEAMAEKLEAICADKVGMARLSGTSMAAPLVAHVAGEVIAENPSLDARGIIAGIMSRSESGNIGVLPVKKLRIRKPSWYGEAAKPPSNEPKAGRMHSGETHAIPPEEVWELVIPPR